VLSNPFGEENFLRDERHILSRVTVPPLSKRKNRAKKLASALGDVNVIPRS
jgi:hypothetical protein